jgi:hypothetical protein
VGAAALSLAQPWPPAAAAAPGTAPDRLRRSRLARIASVWRLVSQEPAGARLFCYGPCHRGLHLPL